MKTLVLLVGSNPLPNYLTAMALQPDRVVLVYSTQTQEPKERLRDVLKDKRPEMVLDEECVEATVAKNIFEKVKSVFEKWQKPGDEVLLNYTGGTKAMAAHARMAFANCGLPAGNASYLDEGGTSKDGTVRPAELRFDNGSSWELRPLDLGLSLQVLVQLHDFELGVESDCGGPLPTEADMEALCRPVVFDEPPKKPSDKTQPTSLTLRDRLFRTHRTQNGDGEWNRAKWSPKVECVNILDAIRKPDGSELGLSIENLPACDWQGNRDAKESRFERWLKFLHGGWQEEWVAKLCRTELQRQKDEGKIRHFEVEVGQNCFRTVEGRKLQAEIDVLIVRDHRFYAISCTTDRTKDLCKLKLFEASVRARQLGGDLARVALVCFLHGCSDKGGSKVDELEREVADSWEASHRIRVFGLDHQQQWLGQPESGQAADTSELAKWLES